MVWGSGVCLVEVGDSLWCICDEGSGFPRVVALPPDLVLEFVAEEVAVQDIIDFVLRFTLD